MASVDKWAAPKSTEGVNTGWDFHPKLLLTILTRDDQVDEIVDAIIKGARTGKIGDGKIVVTSIDEVIRIRTGEIGKAAV